MNDSRIKKTKKNFIYAVVMQVTKILLALISRMVFVKTLGATYLGISGLFSNLLSMLSIADLGITTAMMYSLYRPLAEYDNDKVAMYISFFKKVYDVIAVVVFISGMILMPFLKYIVNLPENVPHIYMYYAVMVINTALTYLYVYKTTLLSADQKAYIISKYDTVFQVIMFVLQCIVLVVARSFLLYLLISVVCTVVGNVFKARRTDRIYPYLKERSRDIKKEERREIFANVKSLFLYRIGGVLQSNTDNILISIFVGTIVVGYYSNYSMIVVMVTTFISLIFTSIKASIGNHVNTQNLKEQFKIYNVLEVYNFWIVAFCVICFLELIPPFIEIFFGSEFILDYTVLIWICLNFYTSNIRQTLWAYRETTGMYNNSIKYVTLVTAVINVILSIILGRIYGLEGVIAATVIARMLYAWWKEPKIIFNRYFKKSSRNYFVNYILRFLYVCVVYAIVGRICASLKIDNLYLDFAIKGTITIVLTAVLLVLPYIKSEAVGYIKKAVKGGEYV